MNQGAVIWIDGRYIWAS